jgi:hypothetical protein
MAQGNLVRTDKNLAAESEAPAVETDWSAVAAEISAVSAAESGSLGVRDLQNRAASALTGSDPAMADDFTPWSARRQLAFIVGACTLCWGLILAPAFL